MRVVNSLSLLPSFFPLKWLSMEIYKWMIKHICLTNLLIRSCYYIIIIKVTIYNTATYESCCYCVLLINSRLYETENNRPNNGFYLSVFMSSFCEMLCNLWYLWSTFFLLFIFFCAFHIGISLVACLSK